MAPLHATPLRLLPANHRRRRALSTIKQHMKQQLQASAGQGQGSRSFQVRRTKKVKGETHSQRRTLRRQEQTRSRQGLWRGSAASCCRRSGSLRSWPAGASARGAIRRRRPAAHKPQHNVVTLRSRQVLRPSHQKSRPPPLGSSLQGLSPLHWTLSQMRCRCRCRSRHRFLCPRGCTTRCQFVINRTSQRRRSRRFDRTFDWCRHQLNNRNNLQPNQLHINREVGFRAVYWSGMRLPRTALLLPTHSVTCQEGARNEQSRSVHPIRSILGLVLLVNGRTSPRHLSHSGVMPAWCSKCRIT